MRNECYYDPRYDQTPATEEEKEIIAKSLEVTPEKKKQFEEANRKYVEMRERTKSEVSSSLDALQFTKWSFFVDY